jgi:hypothetical protein
LNRGVSTAGYGPFENDEGRGVVNNITSVLEAQLVSFVHRVKFGYAMHYDRARAAAVLLTKLARTGVAWSPPEDATPAQIEQTFRSYFQQITTFAPALREAIEADIAELVSAFSTADVAPAPTTQRVGGALRAIGAEPAAWAWGYAYAFNFEDAWKESEARRVPQVALALGIRDKDVIRAMAKALLREAKAVKRSKLDVRDGLLRVLDRLAADGAITGSTRKAAEQVLERSKVIADAVVQKFRQHMLTSSFPYEADSDPLEDALHLTAELTRMCRRAQHCGALDPYQAGDFVEKLARDSRTNAVRTVRAALEPGVLAAARRRANQPVVFRPAAKPLKSGRKKTSRSM